MKIRYQSDPETGRPALWRGNQKLAEAHYQAIALFSEDGVIYAGLSPYWDGLLPTECVLKIVQENNTTKELAEYAGSYVYRDHEADYWFGMETGAWRVGIHTFVEGVDPVTGGTTRQDNWLHLSAEQAQRFFS